MERWLSLVLYCFKDAAHSRTAALIAVISIAVACATATVASGTVQGFNRVLAAHASRDSGAIIVMPAASSTIPNITGVTASLNSLPNVASWSVRSGMVGTVSYGVIETGVALVRGVDPGKESETTGLKSYLLSGGSYLSNTNQTGVVVGYDLARRMMGNLYANQLPPLGTPITFTRARATSSVPLRVVGIFKTGTAADESLYMDASELAYLDPSLKDSDIAVSLKNPALLESTVQAIEEANPDLAVGTWINNVDEPGIMNPLREALHFAVFLLFLAVFAITCAALSLAAAKKRGELRTLVAMGAGKKLIAALVMGEALAYAIVGCLLGFILTFALIGCFRLLPLSTAMGNVAPTFSLGAFIETSILLIAASLLGSVLPALWALRFSAKSLRNMRNI